MHILVMHRVPDSFVRYGENIDHTAHDVTYVSVPERTATLPADVRARRLQRQGTGDTAAEVIAAVTGLPRPALVVALSEYDLLAAARVREALHVAGPVERDTLLVRDKVVMKAAVAAAGLRVPRFAALAAALRDGAGSVPWPGQTVLKPLAGASSEGISTYPTAAAALDAVRRGDVPVSIDEYEIEEFVEGPVFHVDGLMAAGQPVAIQSSRYVGTCLGYALGRPLGSVQTETEPGLTDWSLRCLKAVGIDDGPFHLEGIDAVGGLVFLEVGARFGGADVVDTFELATGLHLPSAQVKQLVGDAGPVSAVRVPGPGQRYGWFVIPGHTLGSRYCQVSGTEPFRDDPVVYRWVQRAPGEPVKDSITYADSDVPLAGVVGPASTASLERFMTGLFESVRIEPREPSPA